MSNEKTQPITFIIRASGEATVKKLKNQLDKQITTNDKLLILDDEVSFEEKLKQGYELAIKEKNKFSVFIDGDILLRSNAIKRIRKLSEMLDESDFGFGLKLWDRFYNQPKFRGLHVYNTELLNIALMHIPEIGEQLRPESFVKAKMLAQGYIWRNNISLYVAGLHDYYQKPQDIYYKFLVRSKRSVDDISVLKSIFQSEPSNLDYKIALKGLEDSKKIEEVINNKFLYESKELNIDQPVPILNKSYRLIDFFIIKKLAGYYKLNYIFWKSI